MAEDNYNSPSSPWWIYQGHFICPERKFEMSIAKKICSLEGLGEQVFSKNLIWELQEKFGNAFWDYLEKQGIEKELLDLIHLHANVTWFCEQEPETFIRDGIPQWNVEAIEYVSQMDKATRYLREKLDEQSNKG